MWNWTCETSKETNASVEQMWNVWKDVQTWPLWDDELEWSRLEGPFEAGTKGSLKPKKFSALKFKIVEVINGKASKSITAMPLGSSLEFRCLIEPLDSGKSLITHHIRAKGPLAPLLRFSMRPGLKAKMPLALKKLTSLAKEK